MPQQYVDKELLEAFRKDFPDLAGVPDAELQAAVYADYPDLRPAALSPDPRSAAGVAAEGVKNTLYGGVKALLGIPEYIYRVGTDPVGVIKAFPEAVKSMVQPLTTTARGANELLGLTDLDPRRLSGQHPYTTPPPSSPPTPVTPEEWATAQQGAGANLAGLLIPEAGKAIKGHLAKNAPVYAERVKRYYERGLGPTTKSELAAMEKNPTDITLGTAGTDPLRLRIADGRVFQQLKEADVNLMAARMGTPKTTTIPKNYANEIVDRVLSEYDPMNPAHVGAIKQLQSIKDRIAELPDSGNFHQLDDLVREVDGTTKRSGGFKPAVRPDPYTVQANKSAAGGLRDLVGEYAADKAKWNAAKSQYYAWKTRAEIGENRRPEVLAQRGRGIDAQIKAALRPIVKGESGIPGIGMPADDILAASAGGYAFGKPGMMVAEGANILGRNAQRPAYSRGVAKINEALLKASGRKYGEFFPPYTHPPSDFITSVRSAPLGTLGTPNPGRAVLYEGEILPNPPVANPPWMDEFNLGSMQGPPKPPTQFPRMGSRIEGDPRAPSFIDPNYPISPPLGTISPTSRPAPYPPGAMARPTVDIRTGQPHTPMMTLAERLKLVQEYLERNR